MLSFQNACICKREELKTEMGALSDVPAPPGADNVTKFSIISGLRRIFIYRNPSSRESQTAKTWILSLNVDVYIYEILQLLNYLK